MMEGWYGVGSSRGSPSPRLPHEDHPEPADRSRARQILDDRYARGEIDTPEYHARLQHLQDDETTPSSASVPACSG